LPSDRPEATTKNCFRQCEADDFFRETLDCFDEGDLAA
jgi:hypothetical protein